MFQFYFILMKKIYIFPANYMPWILCIPQSSFSGIIKVQYNVYYEHAETAKTQK